jgi:hypothetical protein
MVVVVGAVCLILTRLLHFVCLLATISSFLLHSEESKQFRTGSIMHRTTSILKALPPDSRHTIKEGLMQLILSEREIVAGNQFTWLLSSCRQLK